MIAKFFGLIVMVGCLVTIYVFEMAGGVEGGFRIFHWPAIVLTGLGPVGLVLMCAEWDRLRGALGSVARLSPSAIDAQNRAEVHLMRKCTNDIYQHGVRALEKHLQGDLSPSLRKVLKRILARMPIADVAGLVEREQTRAEQDLAREVKVFGLGVRFAPSIGMLGTILGMVQLLSHLKDPANLGSYMSLALLTTFYGLFFSLALWNPLQHRLETILDARMNGYENILHWLEIMEERKPIQYFEENLREREAATDGKVAAKTEAVKPKAAAGPVAAGAGRSRAGESRLEN